MLRFRQDLDSFAGSFSTFGRGGKCFSPCTGTTIAAAGLEYRDPRVPPLQLQEARNAVAITRATVGERYAADTLAKALVDLTNAEGFYRGKTDKKQMETNAREAPQMADYALSSPSRSCGMRNWPMRAPPLRNAKLRPKRRRCLCPKTFRDAEVQLSPFGSGPDDSTVHRCVCSAAVCRFSYPGSWLFGSVPRSPH
jgi:hypothetical protein